MLEVLCYTKKYRGSIKENSVIREHNTRRKNDLHIQPCRTSSFQKSVINMGIKLFNHLSTEHNLLKPNDIYICRTAAPTSGHYILNIYSTNIHTEYFKHAA